MIKYKKNWTDFITLSVTVIISIIIIVRYNDRPQATAIHTWSLEISGLIASPFAFWQDLLKVHSENQRLKQRNIQLQLENSRLFEDRIENKRLLQLLEQQKKIDLKNIPARVIGLDGMMGIQSFVLDKGRRDGVEENMPVVASEGLAGKIIRVSNTRSVAQAVSDKNFRVAARLRDGRYSGIFKGTGTDKAELWGIPLSANVEVGEKVITLGMDSLFPPFVNLGTVEQIKDSPDGLFHSIKVMPAESYSRVEHVLIIARTDSVNENSNL